MKKLTTKQEAKIVDYRERYFQYVTNIKSVDRSRVESAAKKIAEMGGLNITKTVWVNSPKMGREKCNETEILDELLPLRTLLDSFRESFYASFRTQFNDELWKSVWWSLWGSLKRSIQNSKSLYDLFWDADSFWDFYHGIPWLALYTYVVDVFGMNVDGQIQELLSLYNELAIGGCCALWILPDTVVLCERPTRVEIQDGNVSGIVWDEYVSHI